jgi:hypothetical protein
VTAARCPRSWATRGSSARPSPTPSPRGWRGAGRSGARRAGSPAGAGVPVAADRRGVACVAAPCA